MKYNSFINLSFEADNREDMYEKIWTLEKILEDNNYHITEHHTALTDNLRSVRYGR